MSESSFHPIAEIFPLMSDAQLEELAADIAENGLREPIWRHKGQIIDGRNRWLACAKYGITPTYREYEGEGNGDLTKFVVSVNLHRRHLNESQRAMIAAKLATRTTGRNKLADQRDKERGLPIGTPSLTQKEAEALLNVGKGSVDRAKHVEKNAIPEIVEAVQSGEMRLYTANEIAKEPREQQAETLKARREGLHHELSRKKSTVKTKSLPKTNVAKAIRSAFGTLVGICSSLGELNAKDANFTAQEAKQWDGELEDVVAVIRRCRRQLMEVANG